MADLTLVPTYSLDAEGREQLRAIYLDSFPAEEREPFDSVSARIADGTLRLYLGYAGAEVVGFAIVIPMHEAGADLIDYFAIARDRRDRGLGGQFLRQLASLLAADAIGGIVLEVECDDDGTEAERQLRRRRIGFYRRHGLIMLTGAPTLCVPSTLGDGLLRTKLMWLPLRPQPPDVRAVVAAVYRHAYGLGGEHPLVQQALGGVTIP